MRQQYAAILKDKILQQKLAITEFGYAEAKSALPVYGCWFM